MTTRGERKIEILFFVFVFILIFVIVNLYLSGIHCLHTFYRASYFIVLYLDVQLHVKNFFSHRFPIVNSAIVEIFKLAIFVQAFYRYLLRFKFHLGFL